MWGSKEHVKGGSKDFRRKWDVDYTREDRDKRTGPFSKPWRHFRDRSSIEKDLSKDIEKRDIRLFERHIHQGQDTYSHYDKGYRWYSRGHIDQSILHWVLPDFIPEPDDPIFHRDEYNEMSEWTKEWEKKWEEGKCK